MKPRNRVILLETKKWKLWFEQSMYLRSKYGLSYLFLFGNQPFSTRFFCSKTSPMLQKEENPKTPHNADKIMFSTKKAPVIPAIPKNRNTHQHLTPK